MSKIIWELPLLTVSELNCSEHWAKKSKRHKKQKFFVKLALKNEINKISLPCSVKITRLSSRSLDYDNLVSSQKWVVDAICDLLIPGLKPGRADGDERIKIFYHQEKSRNYGIKIEISNDFQL